MNTTLRSNRGFSSIVNLLVLVTLAIILTMLLLPSQDESIRAHVSQGLRQADMAKAALAQACRNSADKVVSNNADAGYFFMESKYVANIELSADCASGTMGIRVRMQNTGAKPDPEILLMSDTVRSGQVQPEWRCGLARGDAMQVPAECRDKLSLG